MIPLMAAVVPIVGAFEHWFGGGGAVVQASTLSEYAAVCNLSNTRQRERERELAKFRVSFEHARDPTSARDAMLLLSKQDIAATSELENGIQALTPSQSQAGAQRQLEGDWKANLTVLGKYRERLGEGVTSAAQLVKVDVSLPRSSIEARTADARGRLLRLGAPACMLDPEREQPIADWSPALRNDLRRREGTTNRSPTAISRTVQNGSQPPLPEPEGEVLPEGGEVLPEGQSPNLESPPPQRNLIEHVKPEAVKAMRSPESEPSSTTGG